MKKQTGFTLIELLVVIAIIGILSSVVLASLSTARAKSRDARRISDIGQLQLSLEMYYDASSSYLVASSSAAIATSLAPLISSGYLPKIPVDPTGSGTYIYKYGGDSKAFHLGSQLERFDNIALQSDADATNTTPALVSGMNGLSADCAGAGATAQPAGGSGGERCYDVTN